MQRFAWEQPNTYSFCALCPDNGPAGCHHRLTESIQFPSAGSTSELRVICGGWQDPFEIAFEYLSFGVRRIGYNRQFLVVLKWGAETDPPDESQCNKLTLAIVI